MGCPDIDEVRKYRNYSVGTEGGWGYATNCLVCGESVHITPEEAHGVCIKICNNCKDAVLYARELKRIYEENLFRL